LIEHTIMNYERIRASPCKLNAKY